MKKISVLIITLALILLIVIPTFADEEEYVWKNHADPFGFTFGNMIDTHQQSFINGNGILKGFLYIHYTGETTIDGIPVAERANCPDCNLGWNIKGIKVSAKLLQKGPRCWYVDPAELPDESGYNHFQWVGDPPTPHSLQVGDEKVGYLLKRVAISDFFWLGGQGEMGSGGHLVKEGVDPHMNIVLTADATLCKGHGGGDHGGGHDGGGCSHDDGGCSGDDGSHDDGGCSGDDGGCSGDDGSHDDGGCTGDDGGCSGDDGGGCSDEGGCAGG